ncbi:MAG: WecB/TagA/CpsF family glycosyltransferase [Roseiflexaceae bacterium]|nr:WecB/TagA/CpsF family glycosyltransferase [Roseiflexaceae bacterium]
MRKLLVVLGVPVDNLTMEEALDQCDEFIAVGRATGRTHQIATVNADFVVNSLHDPELQRILQEADMSTADGMPLVWGSRLLGGTLPSRVTGADMVPALAERAAQKGYSIFFLGARPGVAARAAEMLQARYPGLNVAGVFSPPPSSILEMDSSVVERVKAAHPDILLVAFGNPKQEKWIRMHSHELQVPICIGVGGTLDMIVGVTKRAPAWMQKTGLEWLYRLSQEPKRLVKRYVQDFGYFGYFFARQWWGMRRGTALNMAPTEPVYLEAPHAPEMPSVAGISDLIKDPPVTEPTILHGKTPVLHIRGRLDVSNQSSIVSQATNILERSPYLIVSMAETEFLDSSALGALVALANRARAAGGALWIVEVPPQIANLLNLVRLDRFFEIYSDVETAESHRHQAESPVVTQSNMNGWLIIKMPRLVDAGNAPEMLNRCMEQMDAVPLVVLDFSETVFLASAGMAMMIKLDRLTRAAGGALRIADCSHDVLRTLKLMKLDTILGIYPDIAIATTGDILSPTDAALPHMHVSVGRN